MAAVRRLGHEVDSINSLGLKGLDDGILYRGVAQGYDLFFTKDLGFARNVQRMRGRARVKLLRVVLRQTPPKVFADDFVRAFESTDWPKYQNGGDWP